MLSFIDFKTVRKMAGCGVLMGSADVVPGVSGGTVALILGIYQRLISAIAAVDRELISLLLRFDIRGVFKKIDGSFLLGLGLGVAVAVLTLARVITTLLDQYPVLTWSFFFGLILASSILVIKGTSRFRFLEFIALILGGAFAYWIALSIPEESAQASHVVIFFSGMIAISAMILPGISGSFILLLLGKYKLIMTAIKSFDLGVIFVFGGGCLLGLILFSKVLKVLLARFETVTMAAMSGLMIGSLFKIWPFKEEAGEHLINVLPNGNSPDLVGSAALFILALGLVFGADYFAFQRQRALKQGE